MKSSDIYYSLLIFIIFGIGLSFNAYTEAKIKFKEDWPENKCNPLYMPFADMADANAMTNFMGCIGDIQFNMMPDFLGPIAGVLDTMNALAANQSMGMGSIFSGFSAIRDRIAASFSMIFGIFGGITVTLQFMLITFRSIMSKMHASMNTMFYTLETAGIMAQSLQNTAFYSTIMGLAKMFG